MRVPSGPPTISRADVEAGKNRRWQREYMEEAITMFEWAAKFPRFSVALVMLAFAATNYSHVGLAQQAAKIRWDGNAQ